MWMCLLSGGVPGRLRRSTPPSALHERVGQRPDSRHPRRWRQRTADRHGHGVHLLHHSHHLTHTQSIKGGRAHKEDEEEET